MHVTYDWQDASYGYTTLDIAGAVCSRLGGGSEAYPALVQHRIQPEKPDPSDRGEIFEVVGLKARRLVLEPGEKLWLKAHVSQQDLRIERSVPLVLRWSSDGQRRWVRRLDTRRDALVERS